MENIEINSIEDAICHGMTLVAMTYGLEHQLVKTLEELGELSAAISKALLNRTDKEMENKTLPDYVIEEIADVRIMITHLIVLTDIRDKVDNYALQKLHRQVNRIYDEQRTKEKE